MYVTDNDNPFIIHNLKALPPTAYKYVCFLMSFLVRDWLLTAGDSRWQHVMAENVYFLLLNFWHTSICYTCLFVCLTSLFISPLCLTSLFISPLYSIYSFYILSIYSLCILSLYSPVLWCLGCLWYQRFLQEGDWCTVPQDRADSTGWREGVNDSPSYCPCTEHRLQATSAIVPWLQVSAHSILLIAMAT